MFSLKLGSIDTTNDDWMLGGLSSDILLGDDGFMPDMMLGEPAVGGSNSMSMEQQLWDEVVSQNKAVPNVNPADLEEFSPDEKEEEEVKVEETKAKSKKKNKRKKGGKSPSLAPKSPTVAPKPFKPIIVKSEPEPTRTAVPTPDPTPAPKTQSPKPKPKQNKHKNKPKPKSPAVRPQPAPVSRQPAPSSVSQPERKTEQKQQPRQNHHQNHQANRRKTFRPDDVVTISIAELTTLLAKNNEHLSEGIVQYMTSPRLFNATQLRTKLTELQDSNVQSFLSSSRFKKAVQPH